MFGTALCSEPPFDRNRLMFGTALRSEPPYVRNRLIFGTALNSEPPYVRNRLTFGTALCSEPPYIRNCLIFGTAFCSEPPYVRNRLIFGTALYSEPSYVRNRLTFGTALCSEPPNVRSYAVIFITAGTLQREVQYLSAHTIASNWKDPLCLSGGRRGRTCRQMKRPEWWAKRKHHHKPQKVRSLHIAVFATGLRPGQRSRFSHSLRAAWSGNRILVVVRFSALVQTGPVVRPASCITGTGFVPRGKVAGAWHWPPTQPHLALRLTHCGRVTQICVFNTVKLGTSASSP